MTMHLIATCAFGLEKLIHDEIKKLGFWVISTEDGRITFEGDQEELVKANLWLRCADRIQIKIGEFDAVTFDELFDAVHALEWEKYIGNDDAFPVNAVSVKSALHSEPAIQSIVKKAVVKRLQKALPATELPEDSEAVFSIHVKANKDRFVLSIDSCGDSLHKRGYRTQANISPIKETLAAALVKLSDFSPDRTLVDLFCGSGTILIEAYLMANNIAPGLKRTFAFQSWPWMNQGLIEKAYTTASEASRHSPPSPDHSGVKPRIYGFDIDPLVLKIAKRNAANAGFEDINLKRADFNDLDFSKFENCTFVCNPPYGERAEAMGTPGRVEKGESALHFVPCVVREMYKALGRKFRETKNCSLYIITSHQDFPQLFGRKEDKNRKLFNGNLRCYFFSYFKK